MEIGLGGGGGGGGVASCDNQDLFCYVRINLHCTFKLKPEMINNTM